MENKEALNKEQEWSRILSLPDDELKLIELEKYITLYPDSAEAFYHTASLCTKREIWEKARKYYEKAIELEPSNPNYHFKLAVLLQNKHFKDFEKARKLNEKAIELKPEETNYYFGLAVLLQNEHFKDFEKAKKLFEKAIQLNPNNAYSYSGLARLLQNNYFKEFENAKKHYEKAIELEQYYYAYTGLAELLEDEHFREYDEAKKLYEKAIQLKPDFAYAYNAYANLLQNDYFREYDEARILYEKAIKLEPDYVFSYSGLAKLLRSEYFREFDFAKNLYEKAIALSPEDPSNYAQLTYLLISDHFKDYELAKKYCEKALELDINNESLLIVLSILFQHTFEFESAKEKLNQVLNMNPRSESAHYFLACLYAFYLPDKESAQKHFKFAIELSQSSDLTNAAREGLKAISFKEPSFISEINIKKIFHIQNIQIPIDENSLKHLIITGYNGCGKTVLLNRLRDFLQNLISAETEKALVSNFEKEMDPENPELLKIEKRPLDLYYKYRSGFFIIAHFDARRNLKLPGIQNIENIRLPVYANITVSGDTNYTNKNFLKYAVNQYNQWGFAVRKKDTKRQTEIERWIANFENIVRTIDDRIEKVELVEQPDYHFEFIPKAPYERFTFEQLADGFASIFSIVAELILRMANKTLTSYDIEGLVLLDEPEAHLHLDLQKKVLPMLTKLFPRVQFIVTTHSPFILSSLENAVVYDLEKKWIFDKASQLSYSGLVENFFKVNSEYSVLFEERLKRYETLAHKGEWNEAEEIELARLDSELNNISPLLSPEMYLKVNQIHKSLQE